MCLGDTGKWVTWRSEILISSLCEFLIMYPYEPLTMSWGKNDQCCYFSVLPMAMNDSTYRDITRKNSWRKWRMIDLHPDLLVFTNPSIMSCGHILRIHVMSRGRRHVSRGIENACNIMSLGYEIHILLLF
jgi:hypothetical protein